jgi:arylformamidase
MSEYFEISPLVSESIAVFPGDAPFRRHISLSFANGNHLELSSISGTVHLGAHADATNHYSAKGEGVELRNVMDYIGPCQVVQVCAAKGERLTLKEWAGRKITAPRILFATGSYPDPERWNDDFNSLSPELINYLASAKVRLVGIDTPSVDPANSKQLESHKALWQHKLAVLEGLVLKHVPEGEYDLVAAPLRLKGLDASPVRAILLRRGHLA